MNERQRPVRKYKLEALQKQLRAALTPEVAMNTMRADRDMLQTRCDNLTHQLAEKDRKIVELEAQLAAKNEVKG
jgi:hypothetical protein